MLQTSRDDALLSAPQHIQQDRTEGVLGESQINGTTWIVKRNGLMIVTSLSYDFFFLRILLTYLKEHKWGEGQSSG